MYVFYVATCLHPQYIREREKEKNIWDGRIEGKIIVDQGHFQKLAHEFYFSFTCFICLRPKLANFFLSFFLFIIVLVFDALVNIPFVNHLSHGPILALEDVNISYFLSLSHTNTHTLFAAQNHTRFITRHHKLTPNKSTIMNTQIGIGLLTEQRD